MPEETDDDVVTPFPFRKKDPCQPITATPFRWIDPAAIPPRQWVYGWHYVRQFVSATVAPGGVGKSTLAIAEALAICTGRALLGVMPHERTNVWIWNGEDPLEEMQRRVVAAACYYEIDQTELEGRLFIDSGRSMPITIARQTNSGTVIQIPQVQAIKRAVADNHIGVMTVDPFVASHQVTENDNSAINIVARQWAEIADETGCAVDLVHHSRKTNGTEVTVEDGRGAVALLSAARAARALNPMTEEEAEGYGITNRRLYFRTFDGKANLAPPSDASTWFRLQSFDLGNGTAALASDRVAVLSPWQPPGALDAMTEEHMHQMRQRLADGTWRDSPRAEKWAGHLVADIMGLDAGDPAHRRTIGAALKSWKASGAIKVVLRRDGIRHERHFVIPGSFHE